MFCPCFSQISSPATVWRLYQTMRATGRAASSLLAVPTTQPWAALMVDQAVTLWGTWVESKLHDRDDDGRPRWALRDILQADSDRPAGAANFASEDELRRMVAAGSW